jgi:hypothetical protein
LIRNFRLIPINATLLTPHLYLLKNIDLLYKKNKSKKENHDLQDALKNYLELLEKEEYFDAHEALEEAWHPLRKTDHPLKILAKGLINGAICFEHKEAKRKELTTLNSYE